MELLLINGDIVKLEDGRVQARSIIGRGNRLSPSGRLLDFSGDVTFDSVAMIQLHRKDGFATLMALAATSIVLGQGSASTSDGAPGINVTITYPSSGGGYGSCPLAYSFDGDSMQLESETYVGAICTKLERTATDVLAHIRPSGDSLTIRILNDSPETHLTNSVRMSAVDHPIGTTIVADFFGSLHTVRDPLPCLFASDERGNDIQNLVASRDRNAYTTDLSAINPNNTLDLRDAITCEFSRPDNARRAKLIVRCMNSDLGDYALNKLFSLRGPSKLAWYHQLDTNPFELRKLANWMMREGGLEVSVWQNNHWVKAGTIAGVGGRAYGDRMIAIDLGPQADVMARVKLEGTSGLWKIDAAFIDFSDDAAITVTEANLRSTATNTGIAATPLLSSDDKDYLRTITDQWVDLTFDTVATQAGTSRSYILQTTGHYFGWFGQDEKDNSMIANRILTEPLYGSTLYFKDWLATQTGVAAK
jgi:hypothetical protein